MMCALKVVTKVRQALATVNTLAQFIIDANNSKPVNFLMQSCYFLGSGVHTSLGADLMSPFSALQHLPQRRTPSRCLCGQATSTALQDTLANISITDARLRLNAVIDEGDYHCALDVSIKCARARGNWLVYWHLIIRYQCFRTGNREALIGDANVIAMKISSSTRNIG